MPNEPPIPLVLAIDLLRVALRALESLPVSPTRDRALEQVRAAIETLEAGAAGE